MILLIKTDTKIYVYKKYYFLSPNSRGVAMEEMSPTPKNSKMSSETAYWSTRITELNKVIVIRYAYIFLVQKSLVTFFFRI